jgi:hypothetical protein
MLIVVTMRWSTSLRHYSATSSEASRPRGLWRRTCDTASAPSGLEAGGVIAAVVVESYHRAVAVVATTGVATT